MNKTYISNVKIPFKINSDIISFFDNAYKYYRAVCNIMGHKLQEHEVKKIYSNSGYMILPNDEKVTPTKARDDENWFKDISSGYSQTWAAIVIEWVANRYLGTAKRHGKFSNRVSIRRSNTFNTKKAQLKYDHKKNTISFANFVAGGERIELEIADKFFKKNLNLQKGFDIFLKTKNTSSFSANIVLPTNSKSKYGHVVVLIEKKQELAYEPQGFLAFDINKASDNFLASNHPVFDGKKVFPKPDNIKCLEEQIRKIQAWINASEKVKSCDKSFETLSIDLEPEFLPNHLRKPLKCNSATRRQVRLLWKKKHKELERAIRALDVWLTIANYCKKHKLGYAHDNVKTGNKNGTFSQDKLFIISQEKCKLNKIPWVNVKPAYTSRMCPSCGNQNEKNRNQDDFKCVSCGHEGDSHLIAAINISNVAYQNYFGSMPQKEKLNVKKEAAPHSSIQVSKTKEEVQPDLFQNYS